MSSKEPMSAAVETSDDPYKDIELYLEKAQEEIGKTFQNSEKASHSSVEQINPVRKAGEEEAGSYNNNNSSTQLVADKIIGIKKLVQLENILHGLSHGFEGDVFDLDELTDTNSELREEGQEKNRLAHDVAPSLSAEQGINVATRIAKLYNLPPLKQVELDNPKIAGEDLAPVDDYSAHLVTVISAGLSSNARRNKTKEAEKNKCPNNSSGSCSLEEQQGQKTTMSLTIPPTPVRKDSFKRKFSKNLHHHHHHQSDEFVPSSRPNSNLDLNALSTWASIFAQEMTTIANENGFKNKSDDNNNENPCIITSAISKKNEVKNEKSVSSLESSFIAQSGNPELKSSAKENKIINIEEIEKKCEESKSVESLNKMVDDPLSSQMEIELLNEILQIIENNEIKFNGKDISNESLNIKEKNDLVVNENFSSNDTKHEVHSERKVLALSQPSCQKFTFRVNMTNKNGKSWAEKSKEFDPTVERSGKSENKIKLSETVDKNSPKRINNIDKIRTENVLVESRKDNRGNELEEEETKETGRGNKEDLLEEKLGNINDGLDGNNATEFQLSADKRHSLTIEIHEKNKFPEKEKSENSAIISSTDFLPKAEEKMRSFSLPPSSPSALKPTDVQEFIKRVEKSILSLTKKKPKEDCSVEIALRNSLLLNSALCTKAVQNVSTQTSPLISRSSSFLWISETDIAKQQSLLQSDAATCSVNSILSSCSSLEAFSEESLTENSTYSDSDSSSSTSGGKKHEGSAGDRMKINPDTEFFRALSGKKNHIDMSLMNEKLACTDFEECPADDCLLQFPIDDRMHTSRRKGSHSVIPENEEIFDFTSEADISYKPSGKVYKKCGNSCSSSLPTRNNKNAPIRVDEIVRETHSESNIANARINSVVDNKPKGCVASGSFKEKEGNLKPPQQLFPSPLKPLGSSAPNSPVSSPLDESPVTPASASALSDSSTLPMLYITSKSSSAPMLDIQSHQQKIMGQKSESHPPSAITVSSDEIDHNMKVVPPPRSQSVKELTELEAVEACKWLRAAGFPQYAQMFEDMQFPINITAVQKDHYFLDADSIQSLFRRLNALNRCARMRLDNIPRKSGVDDSDEEEQIALSENWTFQRQSRRWSRISMSLDANSTSTNKNNILISSNHITGQNHNTNASNSHCEDIVAKSSPKMTAEFDIPESPVPMDEDGSGGSASLGSLSTSDKMEDSLSSERTGSFRRTSSERLRDGAKAFLRRMESLKTRRSKRKNREAVVISGPQVVDLEGMQRRMQNLACRDLTPPSSASPSPLLSHQRNLSNGHKTIFDDSSSMNSTSDNSQTSTPTLQAKSYHWGIHATISDLESNAFSDSECSPPLWHSSRDANSNETKLIEHYIQPEEINCVANGIANNSNHINFRTGSFNLGKESASYRQKFLERRRLKQNATLVTVDGSIGKRNSVYDNVPTSISNKSNEGTTISCDHSNDLNKKIEAKNCEDKTNLHLGFYQDSDSSNSACTNLDADAKNQRTAKSDNCLEESNNSSATSQTQSLYNSNLNFQVNQQIQVPSLKRPRSNSSSHGLPLSRLSATQLMMVRKLSLLKLTALMERYSPSNRSGWSWIMPKFMKRMKTPDYKDKVMFGVPLTVICQRTGDPLPPCIQTAIQYLRKNAMDSVGIFRKSGVRSRIQKLKNLCEANPHSMSYEGQQSYDVADMLKQYFRELPEALLTNKMSETFICIYQYIPEELRHEALKAAIMLMPDENREVLHKLLSFLHDVSLQSHENQMTGSNLAVCFAPSLFHMNTPRSSSSSPRRRKTVGVPDQKELNENKAAHECLTHMIKEYKRLFSVPEDTMFQCRVSLSDDDESVTLEDLGQNSGHLSSDWKSYINNSIENLLKEAKEKSKNWVSVISTENAEIACKKIGDGNPLRQWKVSVEVEAPPVELLTRVLRERHIWDDQLNKWRVVSRLNNHSEIFQYIRNSMCPLPPRDYCILRSWRTDLPKGACVLVETSVNHPDAPLPPNDVRGFVYLSRYLIEPCGSGKSRITHISRIDTKGRSPEWYNKIYGHISALHLLKIGESFQHSTEGPESKV